MQKNLLKINNKQKQTTDLPDSKINAFANYIKHEEDLLIIK